MSKEKLINGYVVLKINDDIVYDDYNTITTRGREFLLSCFAVSNSGLIGGENSDFIIEEGGEKKLNYTLSAVAFGTNNGDILSTDPQISIPSIDYIFPIYTSSVITNKEINFKDNNIKLSLSFVTADSVNISISELGLYLTGNATTNIEETIKNGSGILFSRISMDPVPLIPSTKISLDYYIYF